MIRESVLESRPELGSLIKTISNRIYSGFIDLPVPNVPQKIDEILVSILDIGYDVYNPRLDRLYSEEERTICSFIKTNGRRCEKSVSIRHGSVPLCGIHDTCNPKLEEEIRRLDAYVDRLQRDLYKAEDLVHVKFKRGSVVYFVKRKDGNIKIGFTSNLKARFNALDKEFGPLRLLATVKGGRRKESELHEQFSSFRIGKTEWFTPNVSLSAYLAELGIDDA